jgi:hypothetical protein
MKKDLFSLSKEDMLEYGIEVLENRAIPCVVDGLKPVHRRILWTCYVEGFKANGPTKKVSRVVGSTLGKFHPHGECLRGDTRVPLLNGTIVKIKDLLGKGKKWVLSFNEKTKKIEPALAHSWRIGQRNKIMTRIVFQDDSFIECTTNHPFLTSNFKWVEARDLNVGDSLFGGDLGKTDSSYRNLKTSFDKKTVRLHRCIANCFNLLREGETIHHKNENKLDNRPINLISLSKGDHAKLHGDYITGLRNGLKTMFHSTKKNRNKVRAKNRLIVREYSKNHGLRKVITAVRILESLSVPLTAGNYEKLRGAIYNLVTLKVLQDKYNLSLRDLKGVTSAGFDSSAFKKDFSFKEKSRNLAGFSDPETLKITQIKALAKALVFLYRRKKAITWKNYDLFQEKHGRPSRSKTFFNKRHNGIRCSDIYTILKYLSFADVCVIKRIETIKVEKESFYDFTVDTHHNMIVLSNGSTNSYNNFVVVHNSSVFDALVNLAAPSCPEPMLASQGNFGGIEDSAAAARYVETRLTKFSQHYLLDPTYLAVTPMIDNYDGLEKEPIYLPAKIPNILLLGSEGIAVGCSNLIPSFSKESVTSLVKKSLKKSCTAKICSNTLEFKFAYGGVYAGTPEELTSYYKTGDGKLRFSPTVEVKKDKIVVTSMNPRMKPTKAENILLALPGVKDVIYVNCKSNPNWLEIKIDKSYLDKRNKLAREIQESLITSLNCQTQVTIRHDNGEVTFKSTTIPEIVNDWVKWRLEFEIKVVNRLISIEKNIIQKLDWLMWAIDNLKIIMQALESKNPDKYLIKHGISKEGASYILDQKVRSLAKLEKTVLKQKKTNHAQIVKGLKHDISTHNNLVRRVLTTL